VVGAPVGEDVVGAPVGLAVGDVGEAVGVQLTISSQVPAMERSALVLPQEQSPRTASQLALKTEASRNIQCMVFTVAVSQAPMT
jgi:hypothetical protein